MEMTPGETSLGSPSSVLSPSHDSAICLIPPQDLWPSINSIRSLYDRAHQTWPPHVNVVYPFVRPEALPAVVDMICRINLASSTAPRTFSLQEADYFKHRHHNTIILRPGRDGPQDVVSELANRIRQQIGWAVEDDRQLHMTVGQTDDSTSDSHNFLLNKARLLTPVSWDVTQLAILVRDRSCASASAASTPSSAGPMRLWGYIDIQNHQLRRLQQFSPLPPLHDDGSSQCPPSQATFAFNSSTLSWQPTDVPSNALIAQAPDDASQLVVASYNVLAEFKWPPERSRYPLLVSTILPQRAVADVLVLQEVTDDFLPHLLHHQDICARYRFSSHGPPGSVGCGPLRSLLNIVVLSTLPFSWEYIPFARKHKGAAVIQLAVSNPSTSKLSNPRPIVLAACHLTQGLAEGAVVAKKNELQTLINHLSTKFPDHPWIIAGDFNLATSVFTIDLARKRGQLSARGYKYLYGLDEMLASHGLQDAWLLTRLRSGVSHDAIGSLQSPRDLFEGEQGATFDPLANSLAAKAVGTGLNNRPQRYDRILFKDALSLRVCGFNTFGKPQFQDGVGQPVASDHWGIRCLLKPLSSDENILLDQHAGTMAATEFRKGQASLGDLEDLKDTLKSLGCMPTEKDEMERKKALQLLKSVLCESDRNQTDDRPRAGLDVVLIPVGSYGLGVWTPESDVDCLCVGKISSKSFFTLAVSKLKRARNKSISIVRIVNAKTGTMLELSVSGIKFDLQYCAAALVAERYPDIMNHPRSDPAFNLPFQSLSKLKPARDLAYLSRSIPDMAKYRLAHLLLKAWAKSRGLYSARFGLLGGINISVMLVPICKVLAYHGMNATTTDIVSTFFHHYAEFDWKKNIVFDPLFHDDIKYHRAHRESMCLLGWHAPCLNTALNASASTVHMLSAELKRARNLLSREDVCWDMFLGRTEQSLSLLKLTARNAAGFLTSYRSYIKIEARYWGPSPAKCRRFVGWLESRCVMVLVDVHRKISNLMARNWPSRFTLDPLHSMDGAAGHQELHCCYLVGLTWQDNADSNQTRDGRKSAEQALRSVLREFDNRIHSDPKYFDPASCWVMSSLVGANDVRQLQPDPQPWDDENAGDTDSGEDLDLDEVEADSELDWESQDATTTTAVAKAEGTSPVRHGSRIGSGGSCKLRSSTDVMNRLRWDPAMDPNDFLVGYEDRFTGAEEKALEQWKTEQTDEEFIPQHRILYFKRKTDGIIVWERRTRTDMIFGSGM